MTTETKTTAEPEIVHYYVWDASKPGLFHKPKMNDRATCTKIECSLPSCPLRAKKTCLWIPAFGWERCPYGRMRKEESPTRRAKSYGKWVRERQEADPGCGSMSDYPPKRIEFIGDWVYLPYPHLNSNQKVPFGEHSAFFIRGTTLLGREHWTLENVLAIIDWRPYAMMGSEITSYQKEEVPKFLIHLREQDADMWEQVIAARPELDVAPDHTGREAYVRTLKPGIELFFPNPGSKGSGTSYPVRWKWDGETLTTNSHNAYSKTWGRIECSGEMNLTMIPSESATIKVESNDWVDIDTKFKV